MLPSKLAFVDLETTGTSLARDRIIDIGILRVEDNTLVKTYNSLVNPQTYVSEFITQMTGINAQLLENAPTFYEIKDEVLELLKDCVFVAHNVRFDYGFLKNELRRYNISYSSKHFCTVKLSRTLFPRFKRHNLDSVIERFGFECKNRHRAFDDAKVLWDFTQVIQQKFDTEKLKKAMDIVLRRPSTPLNLSHLDLDSLPECAGVYIFYAKDGAPLYVGKSKNIKERVLSHFAGDHSSSTEMKIAQQVFSIETIKTAGELGALLKESMLVKQLQPLYNRKLRLRKKLMVLKKSVTKEGYQTVVAEIIDAIDVNDLSSIISIFRSKKQIKEFLLSVAKEQKLCPKLLGIEKTAAACFNYRLGWCKGACVGKESPNMYNLRSILAFSKHAFKPWPFKGPIVIEEKSVDNEKNEAFTIDKWCLIQNHNHDTESAASSSDSKTEYLFDVDTYKILLSFLRSEKNHQKVKQVFSSYSLAM
jgi:DNA polymerase-3 subunit epsilon